MPKQVFIPRQLPPKKPDRCELCPLIGLIPKEDRERGKREKYYCLGIYEPMTDDDGNPILDERGCQRFGFPRLSTRETSASRTSASCTNDRADVAHSADSRLSTRRWSCTTFCHSHESPNLGILSATASCFATSATRRGIATPGATSTG